MIGKIENLITIYSKILKIFEVWRFVRNAAGRFHETDRF